MGQQILTEEQYKSLSRKLLTTIKRDYKIIPLNSLKNPNYILKRPIYITVEYEKNTVIASFDDIEAFAYADTEYEALNSLCEEIINLYEDLIDDRNNLGLLPEKWLKYLEEIILPDNEKK